MTNLATTQDAAEPRLAELIQEPAGTRRPLIITAAVTGGVHGKESNPALPEQPDEIVRAAIECQEAGASVVHCHARGADGGHTADVKVFAKIVEGLRRETDLLVNLTTGGAPGQSIEERLQVLDLAPDMVTLNAGTLLYQIPGEVEEPFINTRAEITYIAKTALERGIKPEIELYNTAMLREVEHLLTEGLLSRPAIVNAVLQTPMQGGEEGTIHNVLEFVQRLPRDCTFVVTACGRTQLPLSTLGMLLGADVRVGFEDNIYYRRGELAQSNAQLVRRASRLAEELQIDVAGPETARELLNIPHTAERA